MTAPGHRQFKKELFGEFARVAKALASPHRLELLYLLAQRERSVDDLAREMQLPIANVSQHLQSLRRARLVEVRRAAHAFYRIADERVYRLYQSIIEVGEARLGEIDRLVGDYLGDRDALEPVGMEELLRRLGQGDVVLLDARPVEEYRAGHIPGALSVPVETLESRLRELPRDKEVIAYCRGPYCLFADEAVAVLTSHGIQARRLGPGLPDWRAAGLPVDREESAQGAPPESTGSRSS